MSGDRERLPNRRKSSTRAFQHAGMRFVVTAGYYADGRTAEVFISGERPGSGIEVLAHDAAVTLSIALQYGADLQVVRNALEKDSDGAPATILGAALSALSVVDIDEVPAS
jgi:hypothetical protein